MSKQDAAKTKDPAPAPVAKATVEELAKSTGIEPWQFASAKAYHRWPQGMELSESEFSAAVAKACNIQIR